MITNNEVIKSEVSKIISDKINSSPELIISPNEIIDIYNSIIIKHIIDNDKIKLPIGTVYCKKRNVNTIMGNDIGFTYKICVDINSDIKSKLINNYLESNDIRE